METSGSFIRLNEDGSANLFIGSTELGQGVTGVMAQIAAEELGLLAGDVHVVKGDTDVTMFDIGQHASRTTYAMGNSVKHASAKAKKKLLERAGRILEISPGDLEIRQGIISVKGTPGRKITIAEVTRDAVYNLKGDAEQITGTCTWESKGNPQSFQAVFAEVEVDTRYGKVRPLRLVAAHDIGRAINPMNVEGQLAGAIIQAIGFSLFEDYRIDSRDGKVLNASFKDYKIPTALDIPEIEIIIVEEPSKSGPFGAKSVGENGIDAVAPAIANAIYDAAGIRLRSLPMTSEKVLEALKRL